jgi:hypothetical protein
LNLTRDIVAKWKAVEWLLKVANVKKDRIAIHIRPGVTLNITPDMIYQLLRVPRGKTRPLEFKANQIEEFRKLHNQLGIEDNTKVIVDHVLSCATS